MDRCGLASDTPSLRTARVHNQQENRTFGPLNNMRLQAHGNHEPVPWERGKSVLWSRVSILTALTAGMALGQSSPATDSIQLGSVDFSATLRLRLYGWDWFQPVAGENAYAYSGDLLRLNFSRKLDHWDWDAEFAVPFLLDLPDKATDAAPQGPLGLGSNDYTANHSSPIRRYDFSKAPLR